MYSNSGYLDNRIIDVEDVSKPLIVESCGTYHLRTQPAIHTLRPHGRKDYQLLYLASGKAHFFFHQKEQVLSAGQMVLYRPGEPQRYSFSSRDQTEIYWVHFTGSQVEEILEHHQIAFLGNSFHTGTSPEYPQLFRQMIQELQICRPCFEELLPLLLQQIFLLIHRQLLDVPHTNRKIQKEVEQAAHFFNEHFNTPICIEAYAASLHISTCWFIRAFKQFTGMTPVQYITSIRISTAQNLLESTNYNVNEIAAIVGYDNPLYFSRIFKKQTGSSPTEYRNRLFQV